MLGFGLVPSGWGLLAVPGAVLIGFGFAGAGLAGTTFMRSWVDFDFVILAMLPMFLFSGSFFPLSRLPGWTAGIVRVTPLYQGVALERGLVLGHLGWSLVGHAAYLGVMGVIGLRVASRRLQGLLQP